MATIDQPRLRIDADIVGPDPQATLTVTYDVHFDSYDQASGQLYKESWKVIGADHGPGEDGVDDTLEGKGAAAPVVLVSSGGAATVTREIIIVLATSELDEDFSFQGTDEIKVEVSLTPILPLTARETSNRVLVSV